MNLNHHKKISTPYSAGSTWKIIMTALFAALACAATMAIRIPTPATGGYVHPGDAIVILSGIILGPAYGLLAGGLGSAMSDLLGGYFMYVPVTFTIKGLVAFLSGQIFRKFAKNGRSELTAIILSGLVDIIFVTGGYFLFASMLYGSSAAASVPANIVQGTSGLIIASLLYPALKVIPEVKNYG